MTEYDAIIFDLDGTLWDASEACARGWQKGLEAYGLSNHQIVANDIRAVSGRPFSECVRTVLGATGAASDPFLLQTIDNHEKDAIAAEGGIIYHGVAEGLQRLAENYRLFLVSNCQAWYLAAFWDLLPVKRYFEHCDCHGLSAEDKPSMLRNLHMSYALKRPIYVGDTEGDRQAATAAGMDFALAAYGFGEAPKAPLRFHSFSALVDYFATTKNDSSVSPVSASRPS